MRIFWAAIVGNIVDHYDAALYGFLAPIIAPLFFPSFDPVVALILTYGVLANSVITRVLGIFFFTLLVRHRGEKISLSISLIGSCLCTVGMGLILPYQSLGALAPLLLIILRSLQSFFSAGEHLIAPFWLLKAHAQKRHGVINSLFQSSTVLGILLASAAAAAVGMSSDPQSNWRWPFLFGSITGAVGLCIRFALPKDLPPKKMRQMDWVKQIGQNGLPLLRVISASGLTYITYVIPFVFLNGFVPLVTDISYADMMVLNTALLILDMTILPFFGGLADRVGHSAIMTGAALGLAFSIVPLFYELPGANLWFVSGVRIWIVLLGLAFLAPLHAWFYRQFPEDPYLLTGLGYAFGSELFGKTAPAVCLWLWHQTASPMAPAIYVALIASFASMAVFERKSEVVEI